jgi:hypothetical protein
LKSGLVAIDILAFSNSFSKEIYSLRALTNSSSSSNLRGGYFLMGEVFLNPDALESLSGLIDSLKGDDSLTGDPPKLLPLLLPP